MLTIYHNPRCSKSRQTLALIQQHGGKVKIIDYLKNPLSADEICLLLKKLQLGPRDLMRKGEAAYKENHLGEAWLQEADLIAAMVEFPILIERPIVVKGEKAIIGRPPENVLALL